MHKNSDIILDLKQNTFSTTKVMYTAHNTVHMPTYNSHIKYFNNIKRPKELDPYKRILLDIEYYANEEDKIKENTIMENTILDEFLSKLANANNPTEYYAIIGDPIYADTVYQIKHDKYPNQSASIAGLENFCESIKISNGLFMTLLLSPYHYIYNTAYDKDITNAFEHILTVGYYKYNTWIVTDIQNIRYGVDRYEGKLCSKYDITTYKIDKYSISKLPTVQDFNVVSCNKTIYNAMFMYGYIDIDASNESDLINLGINKNISFWRLFSKDKCKQYSTENLILAVRSDAFYNTSSTGLIGQHNDQVCARNILLQNNINDEVIETIIDHFKGSADKEERFYTSLYKKSTRKKLLSILPQYSTIRLLIELNK